MKYTRNIGKAILLIWFIIMPIGLLAHYYTVGRISAVYDISITENYLWRARASLDLDEMADYMQLAYDKLEHRTGNPCWWFPTPDIRIA